MEDIAAAFKKMAVINPHQNRTVPAPPKIAEASEATDIAEILQAASEEAPAADSAGSQRKQTLYEGMLQKSIEERRPKKRTEIENQLSLFGFVA